MPRALDKTISEVLSKYGETPKDACWDCHGVWVVYHKAIERMAARAGIAFDQPTVIEANTQAKTATIVVTGTMGDRAEWSFGEASPANNKNAYPFAMAEKRAKDRVVLKLLGLHGLAYSEDESDDFKEPAGNPASRGAGAVSPSAAPAPANRTPAKTYTPEQQAYVRAALMVAGRCDDYHEFVTWWTGESDNRYEAGVTDGTRAYADLIEGLKPIKDRLMAQKQQIVEPV